MKNRLLLLLSLFLLSPAFCRAQSVVQHPNGGTNTTGGTAFNIALTSTSSESIYVLVYTTNTTDAAITDSGSGIYTKDISAQFTGPSNRVAIFSRNSISTGVTSVTITPPAGQFSIAFVITASGMASSAAFDKSSSHQTATGTTFSSNATATLSQAAELTIGLGATGNTGTATLAASGSWTNSAAQVDNTGDGDAARAMYQIVSATTAIAATGTCGSGDQPVVAMIATYKASGGGGGSNFATQVGAFAVGP